MNNKKAFTLIELLLVISIIALLSSVVLSSTMDSRNKAKIATIKENMFSLRNEAEIYRTSFGDFTPVVYDGPCNTSSGGLGTSAASKIINQIDSLSGQTSVCKINKESWAISVNISGLAMNKSYIADTALAATIANMCADSSGGFMLDLLGTSISGSSHDGNAHSITISPAGKFVCNI